MASTTATVLGVAVLATGVFALGRATGTQPEASAPVIPVVETAEPADITAPSPLIDGVDEAILRVLQANGNAQFTEVDQLEELPPAVARVLIERNATLAIPDDTGEASPQ